MKELIEKRTRNSKTFHLGGNRYAWDGTIGAIHYKEKPKDAKSPWLDIDTTIVNGKVRKAPFDLDIFLQGLPGFHYKSKESGEFVVRINTARKDKGKPTVLPNIVKPRIEGNRVIWENIYPDTDVILLVQNTRVSLKRLLKSAQAPLEFDIDIQEVKSGVAKLRPLRPATDAKGQQLVMEETSIAKGRRERLKLEVIPEEEVQPITYPILDSTTVNETVEASTDDCSRRLATSYWSLTATYARAGASSATYYKYGFGMRFQTVAIEGTIDVAYLTIDANSNATGTEVKSRISAEDVDDAPTFADSSAAFDTRWAARTAARVDWDDIASWTGDTSYNSPSIVSVIQEIVDRGGWASGQDIVIFWDDFENRTAHDNKNRVGACYDHETYDPPKLHIEYTAAGAIVVTPTTLAQALTFYTPPIGYGFIPSTLTHALSFYASPIGYGYVPETLALLLTEYAPILKEKITPATLAQILTFYAPIPRHGTKIVPSTLAQALTFYNAVTGYGYVPGTLALSLTEYAPILKEKVTPATLEQSLAFYVPILKEKVTPSTLALALTFYAPPIGYGFVPGTLALSQTFYIPVLDFGFIIPTLAQALSFYACTITIRHIGKRYRLEIRDSSDNLVAVLENAFDISYIRTLNEIPQLDFSLPADDAKVANLVRANKIVLREVNADEVIEQFRLLKLRDSRR